MHSQVWRGRACALGCQCHALGAQKADFSAGEKEHRIAGPSAAEVQFLHHPSSVLGDGGEGGGSVAGDVHVQVCPQAHLGVLPSALRRERGRALTPGVGGGRGGSLGREAGISPFQKPPHVGQHVGSMVPRGRQ